MLNKQASEINIELQLKKIGTNKSSVVKCETIKIGITINI